MNPEHWIQSREVCCCGARSWALLIRWFQTIFSAVGTILIGILLFTKIPGLSHWHVDSGNSEKTFTVKTVAAALAISLIIQFAAVIALIVGVKKGSEGKLKFWYLIQTTLIVLNFVGLVALVMVANDQRVSIIRSGFGMAIILFCLRVVNVYRQEIMQRNVLHVDEV